MKKGTLRETALTGIFWTFFQQFGTQGISFLVSIVMARLLLPAEFGLIGMITVFIAIGQSLIDSGLTQSLIRSENPNQEDYSTVFFFNLGGSIFIYFILFFLSPLIAEFYNQDILTNIIKIYCLTFIISAFSTVQITRLTKIMDFKTQLMVAIPSIIGSGILGIFLAFNGYGVWSLVWMNVFQSFLNTIQLWFRTNWRPSLTFNKLKFKEHFQFGYKLTLSGLLDTIFVNIYQIIIGKYFLASQVGFYVRADSLKRLSVVNISNALNKVTYPLFATIKNDDERLRRVYRELMLMVIFVIAPVLIIMGVLAEPLFRFLFTAKWVPAVPYFQILCLSAILYPIHSYNLNILKVKGRSDLFLKLEIIKKITIVITLGVSIRYGIMGLIWGQLFTSIIAFFTNTYYTGKFLNYKSFQQFIDILPILLLAFTVGGCIWFVDNIMNINQLSDFSRLFLLGIGGSGLYITLAYICKMDSINNIKRIITKK